MRDREIKNKESIRVLGEYDDDWFYDGRQIKRKSCVEAGNVFD